MIKEIEIRQQLANLLLGQLGLEEFEDWLVQRSWNMHLDSNADAQDLAWAIELALSEHSSGHRSEGSLFDIFLSLLSQVRIEIGPDPRQVKSSANSAIVPLSAAI